MKKIFASIKNFIKKMNFAARIAELDEKIWELAKENKTLSARIRDLEEAEVPYRDMKDFSETLEDLIEQMDSIETLHYLYDIDNLDERIGDLESKLEENDLDDFDSRISELEEKLEDIDADSISDLSDKIDELDDKVSELEDKVEPIPYEES